MGNPVFKGIKKHVCAEHSQTTTVNGAIDSSWCTVCGADVPIDPRASTWLEPLEQLEQWLDFTTLGSIRMGKHQGRFVVEFSENGSRLQTVVATGYTIEGALLNVQRKLKAL